MADHRKLVPHLLKWEGGFVNDPDDKGGATMKGVTLTTFRNFYGKDKTVDDLKKITDEQWTYIMKKGYWNKAGADAIDSQSVANAIVDWCYNSGTGILKRIQRIVGVKDDGIVGPKTIAAINSKSPLPLFGAIKQDRIKFINGIIARDEKQKRFYNGWMNRINSLQFED